MSWTTIVLLGAGAYLLKLAGFLVSPRDGDGGRPGLLGSVLPVSLLAALVVVQTVGAERAVTLDARLPALLLAGVAVALRAPFLVVVAVAVVTAALLRLAG